jgi:hypothetical protein
MEAQTKKPQNKILKYALILIIACLSFFGILFCVITGTGIINGVGIGLSNLTTTPLYPRTETFPPTITPSITITPKPTSTQTQTLTPTLTLTPTFTPAPGTLTKQAYFDEATQRSAAITATVTAQLGIRFATETAAMALYNKKLEYSWISVRELTTYPDHHKGEKVIVQYHLTKLGQAR